MRGLFHFLTGAGREVVRGTRAYYAWLGFLAVAIAVGIVAYVRQAEHGLLATHMRDQVSWAFYIGNFAFLVGVGAAAVMLVIPAYVYEWKPLKEVVLLGELLAVSALTMALLFVTVDMGHPERVLHMVPLVGTPNWPSAMLAWDAMVLNVYLVVNAAVIFYVLYRSYNGLEVEKRILLPLVLASIPIAVSTHTVTAYLFNGLAARPYWNASILAPRFLASAFCSGPAVMLVLFQLLRKRAEIPIRDEAIFKVAELMAYAIFINLFLLGAEVFKEFYSATHHLLYTRYLWFGIEHHRALVPWTWASLAANVTAFFLLMVPRWRRNFTTLNLGCALIFFGVFIEKGMGLVVPGMTPDALGEIYEYAPSLNEWAVTVGVFGVGALVLTVLVKVSVPILTGALRTPGRAAH
ncbi:MAG TPA: NrfD/PsrC family molybdoenzyme membrane anchor subunit [Anaeromyxobacteraceae bacterium]|nr:NrfD/PsrC family molybdoenzyme membrane anchor subunit [Anaeromyxobacteraceae bacterium]